MKGNCHALDVFIDNSASFVYEPQKGSPKTASQVKPKAVKLKKN